MHSICSAQECAVLNELLRNPAAYLSKPKCSVPDKTCPNLLFSLFLGRHGTSAQQPASSAFRLRHHRKGHLYRTCCERKTIRTKPKTGLGLIGKHNMFSFPFFQDPNEYTFRQLQYSENTAAVSFTILMTRCII